jgi:hypothetical protein
LKTKQYYDKFEEVNLPSSTLPYISRDWVCHKDRFIDRDYVSKNEGCMACVVDSPDTIQSNINKTNIINTCVYSDKPSDNTVWSKDKCINECSKK